MIINVKKKDNFTVIFTCLLSSVGGGWSKMLAQMVAPQLVLLHGLRLFSNGTGLCAVDLLHAEVQFGDFL